MIVIILWVTELIPVWVTSLLIPILVVWGSVFHVPGNINVPEPSTEAAKRVFSKFFSSAVMLALGAFTMSAAMTKHQLSDRLAYFVLSSVGRKPAVVMLAIMFLGIFLSMWISNVAAPVVCLSLMRPILQDLRFGDPFIKAMLLGIAYSNNIGGMASPISSPQNIVALQVAQKYNMDINWGQFLGISIPFAIICTLGAFGFLWIFYRPKLHAIPKLPEKKLEKFGFNQIVVLMISILTIALWALQDIVKPLTGDNGITALIPCVVFFSLGLLDKSDFKSLSWDVLILLGGGLVLGEAIQGSSLLSIIAKGISKIVSGQHPWVIMFAFSFMMWLFGNFISHTVAAIIILPVVAEVACSVDGGCNAGHMRLLVMSATLINSCAMALPVASFPNAQTFSESNKDGIQYLQTSDYIKTGFAIGIIENIFLISIGYGLQLAFKF